MKKRFFPSILICLLRWRKRKKEYSFLSSILISSNKKKKKRYSWFRNPFFFRLNSNKPSTMKDSQYSFLYILISFTLTLSWSPYRCEKIIFLILSSFNSSVIILISFVTEEKSTLYYFAMKERKVFLILFSSILISFTLNYLIKGSKKNILDSVVFSSVIISFITKKKKIRF